MGHYSALAVVGVVSATVSMIVITMLGLPLVGAVVVTLVLGNLGLQTVGRAVLQASRRREEILYGAFAPAIVGALIALGGVGVVAAIDAGGEPTFFMSPVAALVLATYIHVRALRKRGADSR